MDLVVPHDLQISSYTSSDLPDGFYRYSGRFEPRRWEWKSLIFHLDPMHTQIAFLGRPYFKSDIAKPDNPREDPPAHASALQYLGYVLHATPVHRRRALYAKALNDALLASPDSQVLRTEARLFNDALVLFLGRERVLGKGSDVVPETDDRGITHWTWFGEKAEDGSEPYLNTLGAARVPVYRLLWPLERPHTLVPYNRIPVRDTSICPSDPEHPCVRPSHFRVAAPPPRASRPLLLKNGEVSKQRNLSGIPGYKVAWHWGSHGGEDPDKVYCSLRHHELPYASQVRAELRALKPRVYCGDCRRISIYEATHPSTREPSQWAREATEQIMAGLESKAALPEPDPDPWSNFKI